MKKSFTLLSEGCMAVFQHLFKQILLLFIFPFATMTIYALPNPDNPANQIQDSIALQNKINTILSKRGINQAETSAWHNAFPGISITSDTHLSDVYDVKPVCSNDGGVSYAADLTTNMATVSGPEYYCRDLGNSYYLTDFESITYYPSFFYLKISKAGTLKFTLSGSGGPYGDDMDFIIWGPFDSPEVKLTDLTVSKIDMTSLGFESSARCGCSYHVQNEEEVVINNAQVNEYYILLISNFQKSTHISLQTDPSSTAESNCSIVSNCDITKLTRSVENVDLNTNTFDLTGTIYFNNAPTTGKLIITDLTSGKKTEFNAPFTSPYNYTIANVPGDAGNVERTIEAVFTDFTCPRSVNYFSPAAPVSDHIHNICLTESVTLTPTTTGDTYLWSNGATTQSITVSPTDTTTYSCKVTIEGSTVNTGNLLGENAGGFEFPPNNKLTSEQNSQGDWISYEYLNFDASGVNINIGATTTATNANNVKPSFFVNLPPHSGNYMLICDGSNSSNARVWSARNLKLEKDITYEFSCWAANIDAEYALHGPNSLPKLKFIIETSDGQQTLLEFTAPNTLGVWNEYTATFTASKDYSWAHIYIVNYTTEPEGNDFAIDDVYFGTERTTDDVEVTEKFDVNVSRKATVSLSDLNVCYGTSNNTLTATVTGGTANVISWTKNSASFPGTTNVLNNLTAPALLGGTDQYVISVKSGVCNPVTASANVTAINCSSLMHDSICKGSSLTLTAKTGDTYNWNNGKTTQQIIVAPQTDTTYICVITKGVLTFSDTIHVFVQEPPVINMNDIVNCEGIALNLAANITNGFNNSISWSKNGLALTETSNSLSVTLPAAGTSDRYIIEVNSKFCAAEKDTATVTGISCTFLERDTICLGDDIILNSGDLSDYVDLKWTPTTNLTDADSVSPTFTPAATGDYTYIMTAKAITGNLITNGDFELGNIGFTSDYIYVAPSVNAIYPEGVYTVGPSVKTVHNMSQCEQDHTGGGNMMMINGSGVPGMVVWEETGIQVKPNTNYVFSAWVMNWDTANEGLPQLQFFINNSQIGTTIVPGKGACNWEEFYVIWNSGSSTTANIHLLNQQNAASGNDFAVDDIYFAEYNDIQKEFRIHVESCHIINKDTITICEGSAYTLTAASGDSYTWNNGASAQQISISPVSDTIYVCEVVKGSKQITDSFFVFVDKKAVIQLVDNISKCEGASAKLTAQITGGSNNIISWTKNGSIISGASSNVLNITAPTVSGNIDRYVISVKSGVCNAVKDTLAVTAKICTFTEDTTICLIKSVTINRGDPSVYNQFQWTSAPSAALGKLDNVNAVNPVFTPSAIGEYTFTLSATQNGDNNETDNITRVCKVTVNDCSVYLTIDTVICEGESVIIGSTTYNQAGVFQQVFPGGSSIGTDSIVNLYLDVVKPEIFAVKHDICVGEKLVLNGLVNGIGWQPMWKTDQSGIVFSSVDQPQTTVIGYTAGNYVITLDAVIAKTSHDKILINPVTCNAFFNLNVTSNPVILSVETVERERTAIVTLDPASGTAPFVYVDNNKEYYSPYLTELRIGKHILKITDANGCVADTSYYVDPVPIIPPPMFTPNGDNFNDRWVVDGLDFYPESEVYIYDRFGKLIIKYYGRDLGWDGKDGNTKAPSTDYWYIINVRELQRQMTGHFTLIRH